MVKPHKFVIVFYEEKDVYVPGDEVTGQLEIHLEEEMEMKEVLIKFAGKAHVAWSEGKNSYYKTEKFFSEIVVAHGRDPSTTSDKVSLPAGFHKFPFQFRLPQPLPSSYQDLFGYIRYYVKGLISKPWQIDNKTRSFITVLDSLNLNHLNNMMAPSGASDSKTLCCWCCASGAIEGDIRVDRRGFVPGEWILASASIENHSSSRIRQTSVEFVKIVTYYTTYRRKTHITTLAKEMGPPCNPRDTVHLNNVKLQIPPIPPSESAHCNIIDIQYAVMVMGHLRTCAINLRAYAPVVIGTVPLSSLPQYSEQTTGSDAQPAGTSSTTFGIQAAPPPAYAVATSETFANPAKKDDENDDASYLPKYTYYNWDEKAFSYE